MKWISGPALSGVLFAILMGNSIDVFGQDQDADSLRRQKVLAAIERGQAALKRLQNADGTWSSVAYGQQYECGVTSLVTLALLNSGLTANDPAVAKALNWLKRPNVDPVKTYDIAMVIMALAAADDKTSMGRIAKLASRLEEYQNVGDGGGNWGYGPRSGGYDNSNSQFAVLGLREAAHIGVPVDRKVWERAQEHFLRTQSKPVDSPMGAGWDYTNSGGSYGSMTVAGLASLVITSSMLEDDANIDPNGQIDCCRERVNPADEAIEGGIRWLSRHFQIRSNPMSGSWVLYYLYGLERAGRFTGRRFFDDHDWYREGVDFLIEGQSVRDGVWVSRTEPDQVVSTSFALLFLSKGLSPIVINKLKYGPRRPETGEVIGKDWNRHPRDVGNLTTHLSGLTGWPKLLNWQVVDLRTAADGEGLPALLQSPVQYLSGTESLDSIQGRELELLRNYITQGGFIFAVQNCGSAAFEQGMHDLVRRLFDGQTELRRLPATHDVYRSEFVFDAEAPPELWGVEFGCRTAIIYAPFDHACRWEKWTRHPPRSRPLAANTQIDKSIKLGTNVIAYATGRELWDTLNRPKILTQGDENQLHRGRLTIARLRHTGGWDTAPNALRRLQSALETVGIDAQASTPNLPANDPSLFDYPMLYMHGRKNFQFSEEERNKLQQYLSNGGFLFADSCCGSTQFDESFRKLVREVFNQDLERLPADHEIFKPALGYDIRQVQRRIPSTAAGASSLDTVMSVGEAVLEGVQINGKYVIVYSKYDLSCALERQATTACAGYATEDAVKIGVNLVLYGLFR